MSSRHVGALIACIDSPDPRVAHQLLEAVRKNPKTRALFVVPYRENMAYQKKLEEGIEEAKTARRAV